MKWKYILFYVHKMGVPFLTWGIIEYLKRAKITGTPVPVEVDGLFIDANSIFHPVTAQFALEHKGYDGNDEFLTQQCALEIFSAIKLIANTYKPKKWLYIAVDGVIPMAKIQQQKQRRYASAVNLKPGDYDSSFITPGTPFMTTVHKELSRLVQYLYSPDHLDVHVESIIYSSCFEPGEGEHKIMKYMRKDKIRKEKISGINVIYGNDADLVLLSLGLKLNGLFVCSNTVRIPGMQGSIKQPICIDEMREGLVEKLGGDYIYDFIFACGMIGNDFLPRTFLFSDTKDAVATIIEILAENQGMLGSQQAFTRLLGKLAEYESFSYSSPSLLAPSSSLSSDISREVGNMPVRCTAQAVLNKCLKREVWVDDKTGSKHVKFQSKILDVVAQTSIEERDSVFSQLWYTKMFPLSGNIASRIGMACLEYFHTMYWILYYYLLGHDSVTWLSYYSYHYAPLFSDLYRVLSAMSQKTLETEVQEVRPFPNERRFTPLHQLTAVMHWQSMKYIPKPITDVFFSPKSPLMDMMWVDVIKDMDLTESPNQGKFIVEFADYHTIMLELSLITIPEELAKNNSVKKPFKDKRKELWGDENRRKTKAAEERQSRALLGQSNTANSLSTPSFPQTSGQWQQRNTNTDRGGRGRGDRGRGRAAFVSSLPTPNPHIANQPSVPHPVLGGSYKPTRGGKTIY